MDSADGVAKNTRTQWKEVSQKAGWTSCDRLVENQDCCLPTACGYQFVEEEDGVLDSLNVDAFFSMDGLGIAIRIEDGIGHHFMGAIFSHQTCQISEKSVVHPAELA